METVPRDSSIPPVRTAVFLVIGHPSVAARWPGLLNGLLQNHSLQFVGGVHEAAARVIAAPERILGILVDPEGFSRREWDMVALLKRHIRQPIWSLPARNRREQFLPTGVLPWEVALREIRQLLMAPTPIEPQGSKGILKETAELPAPIRGDPLSCSQTAPDLTHNERENQTEIPVVSEVVEGYDDAKAGPVLTEPEIRALLGP
ncbi:MAG TPA: hypothetical protein VHM90_04285 [Phycisphaerae bacterium]|nr:hypothetical protein [Phycisphaerae bacterium]